jgi:hypothetical protein
MKHKEMHIHIPVASQPWQWVSTSRLNILKAESPHKSD